MIVDSEKIKWVKFWSWYYYKLYLDKFYALSYAFNEYKKTHPVKYYAAWWGSVCLNFVLVGVSAAVILAIPALEEFNQNVLHKQQLSVSFYDKHGTLIGRRGIRLDDSMQLEDYPPYFIDAVLSTEDRRFYSHFGIDVVGTTRALFNNRKGGHTQGGSSITQQLAKNLFLSNERTFERKIKEAFLALALEFNFTKEEILKLYLDRVYMGGGAYGAAEASRHYFNKSAKDLSVSEAAILAGLFKAPSKFSPEANVEESRKRWLTVLSNLRETKKITSEQYEEALLYPPVTNILRDNTAANYFLDWAWEEIKKMESNNLLGDHKVLKVTTTLDLRLQRLSEEIVTKQLDEAENKFDVDQIALVVMNTDGSVPIMIGGNDYRESSFNRVSKSLRQPGSSFKPYVYAAAVDAGILDKDTVVTDRPTCIGNWCPNNYRGNYAGSMPAWQAMAVSINTIPVQLSIQLGKDSSSVKAGRARIVEMANRMGVKSNLYDAQSLPIGSVELTPLDQAVGYNTLASGGYRVQPFAVVDVKNTAGETIYNRKIEREKVLSDRVVGNLNFMLNKAVDQGTGTAAKITGYQIAGKTGTTNAYRDAWFVGYTSSMVGVVWMGNDNNASSNNMTGGSLPARTWKLVMEEALKTQPNKPLLGLTAPVTVNTKTRTPNRPVETPAAPRSFEPPVVKEKTWLEKLFTKE